MAACRHSWGCWLTACGEGEAQAVALDNREDKATYAPFTATRSWAKDEAVRRLRLVTTREPFTARTSTRTARDTASRMTSCREDKAQSAVLDSMY
jgi:hypothetical protein